MIKRLRLAYWAFKNADNLTMLKWELKRDSKAKAGVIPGSYCEPSVTARAWWYLQYLNFKME